MEYLKHHNVDEFLRLLLKDIPVNEDDPFIPNFSEGMSECTDSDKDEEEDADQDKKGEKKRLTLEDFE